MKGGGVVVWCCDDDDDDVVVVVLIVVSRVNRSKNGGCESELNTWRQASSAGRVPCVDPMSALIGAVESAS